jgi:hypothetical protein
MRHLSTLALAGLFGGLLLVGDASACHKKKCASPAPVCEAPKKKCHFKMPKMNFSLHHKKAATCAPVAYESAPVYAAPQAWPSAQASHQGM